MGAKFTPGSIEGIHTILPVTESTGIYILVYAFASRFRRTPPAQQR